MRRMREQLVVVVEFVVEQFVVTFVELSSVEDVVVASAYWALLVR